MSGRFPSVQRLLLHLEGAQQVYFVDGDQLVEGVDSGRSGRTTLTEFFRLARDDFKIVGGPAVRDLLYSEMIQ